MTASGRLSPLNSSLTRPIGMSALRPKADAQRARVRIELMSAFPKADIQNLRIGAGALRLLMAESRRVLTVNMQADEYLGDKN